MGNSIVSPSVSVVVPVFNRREKLIRSVQSIVEQKFDKPFEIVIVDDGSTDGSTHSIQDLADNIRVVRQENQGAAVARHEGIKAARSNIVVFQDSDDDAPPDKLEILTEALTKSGCIAAFGVDLIWCKRFMTHR